MHLIDTHCHLFYEDLKNDLDNVLSRAEELGVNTFICVGTNLEDSSECVTIAESRDNIYASAGVHPHDAKDAPEDFIDQIATLMAFDKVVAVGEMGLDYFRNISPPDTQREVFRSQMKLAGELNKPVIFHNRDADGDVLSILKEFPNVRGVAHCFSSDLETANAFIDCGYYISFSGNITFKNSHLPGVAKELPLNKIMVETDSPYLSPVPYRGKRNEPGRTRFAAEKLGQILDVPIEMVAEQTTANARELFGLNGS